jgi:hypothetical protein
VNLNPPARTYFVVVVDGRPHSTPRDGISRFFDEETALDFAGELRAAGEVIESVYVRHIYGSGASVAPDLEVIEEAERREAVRGIRHSRQVSTQPMWTRQKPVQALYDVLLAGMPNDEKREAVLALLRQLGLTEEHSNAVREMPVDEFIRRYIATLLS